MGIQRTTLRPVDLARAAGISTQQVRNYADAGLLPPCERTDSGYRRFHIRHRDAMLAYRALVPGFGVATARGIIRAVHAGDLVTAMELVDAEHAALHAERVRLAETERALAAVVAATQPPPGGDLRIVEVARRLGVRTSALRVWESAGLLRPAREPGNGYRSFGPEDVRDAHLVLLLRRNAYPLPRIKPVLDGLRGRGDTAELRAAVVDRRAALTRRTRSMLAGGALLSRYLDDHG